MSEGFQRRRGGGAVATFTGFEADLLRSLASQLVELLRNEVAAPSASDDPLEQLLDFSGPTTEPEDPVLARLHRGRDRGAEPVPGVERRAVERGGDDEAGRRRGAGQRGERNRGGAPGRTARGVGRGSLAVHPRRSGAPAGVGSLCGAPPHNRKIVDRPGSHTSFGGRLLVDIVGAEP